MERRHLKTIVRWSWLLILIPILSGLVGFLYANQQQTIYEAEATLIVGPGIDSPNPDLNALRAGEQLMQTYAELPGTNAFQEAIISDLGLSLSTEELDELIIVRPITGTQLLRLVVQDVEAERAIAIVNQIAINLQLAGPSTDENDFIFSRIQQQATNLENDILDIETRIDQLSVQLEMEDDIVNQNLLIQQIADEEARFSQSNSTLANLYEVLQEPLTNRIELIDQADSAIPLTSQLLLILIISCGAGLVISIMVGLALAYLEDDIIDVNGQSIIGGLTVWGSLNVSRKNEQRLVVLEDSESPLARQYYQAAAQLLYQRDAADIQSILFTSLTDDQALSSVIVANLATAIAGSQNSVFLMDVDFRSNGVRDIFDLVDATDLRDLLVGRVDDVNIVDVSPNLKVMPSGDATTTEHSFDLLASPKMLQILRMFKKSSRNYRSLLLTAPPFNQMQDSLTLISQVDAVIFVLPNRKLTNSQLDEALTRAKAHGGNVCGVITLYK